MRELNKNKCCIPQQEIISITRHFALGGCKTYVCVSLSVFFLCLSYTNNLEDGQIINGCIAGVAFLIGGTLEALLT